MALQIKKFVVNFKKSVPGVYELLSETTLVLALDELSVATL